MRRFCGVCKQHLLVNLGGGIYSCVFCDWLLDWPTVAERSRKTVRDDQGEGKDQGEEPG